MNERPHRDSSGRTLADYPRPSVAVDTAVLTLDPDLGLAVLEVRRAPGTGWALPGHFCMRAKRSPSPSIGHCASRPTSAGLHPRQLHVFDDPTRDDRGWVLSVAHVDVVQLDQLASRNTATTRLVPVESPGRLPYDHASIIAGAVEHIRSRYVGKPDPDRLLGDEFTMRELRLAHEQIAGRSLQRDWFRRTMEPQLVATGRTTTGTRGRPAELFVRAGSES